jgi:hypothetical protein
MLRQGFRNGHYIDVCASDSLDSRLQLFTEKGKKGYHRFSEKGNYKIEIKAESSNACRVGRMLLIVGYDGEWKNTHVITTRENRLFMPWKV